MLRFFEGFESQTVSEWTTATGVFSLIAPGRLGGNAVTVSSPSLSKTVDSQATWTIGFGISPPRPDLAGTFLALLDGTTVQVSLEYANVGTNIIIRNGSGAILGTAVIPCELNVWHYYELQVVFSATVGTVTLRKDGLAIATVTGVSTIFSVNASADTLWLSSNNGNCVYDDIYMCDATGSLHTTFLGDCQVVLFEPTADGVHTDFVPSSGANHHAMVDELPADGDVTYVASSTVAATDTYRTPGAATTGSVVGVKIGMTCRKDNAGTRTVGFVFGDGVDAVVAVGSAIALSTDYERQVSPVMEVSPLTSAAWTLAELQADEFGVTVLS